MREEIEKILNDENLTTNEDKLDAITKGLATLVIPKDKYNALNEKYKAKETDYNTLNQNFESYKKSTMTDEDKIKAEKEQLEADKKSIALNSSRLAVKELFFDNGIKIKDDDEDMKHLLDTMISEDKEKSLKLASKYINVLSKTKEDTTKQTTIDLLNGVPKPIVGDPNNTTNQLDVLNKQMEEAVKNKDQIQIAYITRLIQEEQLKQTQKPN